MAQYDLTPYQRDILIKTALGEARGEGLDGMAAVLNNILNRANSGRYPSDPAEVALQPKQYSTWNKGEGGNNPQQFKPGTKAYETAAQVLDGIASGVIPDNTGGALFYHANSISPSWANSVKTNGTLRVGNHTFYPTHPVPPGELPSVATFLDTVRMPPKPQTESGVGSYLRRNTSPLGDNAALPAALQRVATSKANQVTPAIRRPSLPPMSAPDVNALYAGIYAQPKPSLTNPGAVDAAVQSTSQDPTLAAALARRAAIPPTTNTVTTSGRNPIGLLSPGNIDLDSRKVLTDGVGGYKTENSISIGTDQGEVLIPTVVNGKQLSEQAAIEHYQRTGENLGTFQTPQAADRYAQSLHERQATQYGGSLPKAVPRSIIDRVNGPPTRGSLTDPGAIDASVNGITQSPALQAALTRAISRPTPVPQSQIERTQLPIGQSQIERTALPRNVPPDLISQSMQRIASPNPAKLPPIAPSALGPPPSTRSVQSVAMPALGAAPSRTPPRVTVSTPSTVPQRMAAQDIGNVPRALPQVNPFVPEQRYIEPRNVAPVAPYQGPFVPNKGLERLETPTALSFNPIQQPPAFTTQMRPVQVPNPAWSATPAIPAAGTPMSGGLSRDAVALRAKGLAAAQAMANVPKFITVQQPVRVPTPVPRATSPLRITVNAAPAVAPRPAMTPVQALQARGLTAAQAYAQLNANNGGPRTAADRPGKSLSQMSGQAGMTEGFW